mmetsp:Transcript_2855/g.9579  ORF Transcript_2855/g.9579 Transcript_2855/m.9579 type:complete len:126 (-) Transcript_2855:77-454(-)
MDKKDEEAAALRIQARYRGLKAREEVGKQAAAEAGRRAEARERSEREEEHEAALKIQARYRGKKSRQDRALCAAGDEDLGPRADVGEGVAAFFAAVTAFVASVVVQAVHRSVSRELAGARNSRQK